MFVGKSVPTGVTVQIAGPVISIWNTASLRTRQSLELPEYLMAYVRDGSIVIEPKTSNTDHVDAAVQVILTVSHIMKDFL
jgi:hypothetical protein